MEQRDSRRSRHERVEILLVEARLTDVRRTRAALRAEKLGNRLHVVRDAAEALQFLRRRGAHTAAPRPHLVLLNLDLPRGSGRELLAAMKQDARLRKIPVVIVTEFPAAAEAARALQLGAAGIARTPVDFRQLARIVQDITGFGISIVTVRSATPAPDPVQIR